MRSNRKPPMHTAVLCIHMPPELRAIIEEIADRERISLGEAGRLSMVAGVKALGIVDLSRSWGWDSIPSDLTELETKTAERIDADSERWDGP